MKSDLIQTVKWISIMLAAAAAFVAGCAVIGLWMFIAPVFAVLVWLAYGMVQEERLDRERDAKLAKS